MNKAEYKTKCGALLNIISNRNYSTRACEKKSVKITLPMLN